MFDFIFQLLIALVPIIFITVFIAIIVSKVKKVTREYLGMTPSQTMKLIGQGIKEEASTPKPITSLSEVYMPKIRRDFPSMSYSNMETLASNALIASLNAIESKNTQGLLKVSCSNSLVNKVQNIINGLGSQGEEEKYDNIKIHKCGISSYQKRNDEAIVIFEFSLQYEYKKYKLGKLVSSTRNNGLIGAAYKVTLSYNHKMHEDNNNMIYTSNCPNCGAPVDARLGDKQCSYCGSGFAVINERVWQVSDFNLIS